MTANVIFKVHAIHSETHHEGLSQHIQEEFTRRLRQSLDGRVLMVDKVLVTVHVESIEVKDDQA